MSTITPSKDSNEKIPAEEASPIPSPAITVSTQRSLQNTLKQLVPTIQADDLKTLDDNGAGGLES